MIRSWVDWHISSKASTYFVTYLNRGDKEKLKWEQCQKLVIIIKLHHIDVMCWHNIDNKRYQIDKSQHSQN